MFFWWKGGVNHFNQSKGICGVTTSITSTDFQTTLLHDTDICCNGSGLLFCSLDSTAAASYQPMPCIDRHRHRRTPTLRLAAFLNRHRVADLFLTPTTARLKAKDNKARETMTERQRKTKEEGRKEGRREEKDAGDCTSYLGRMHKRSHSSLHCCGLTCAALSLFFPPLSCFSENVQC